MKWPDMSNVADRAMQRRNDAIRICGIATQRGLNANVPMILRNFQLWDMWARGNYATGYLMRKTGVQRITDARNS